MPIQCSSITLDGEFADAEARFRAATGEAPADIAARAPFKGCTGTGVPNTEASRKDYEPLFQKYGVDLFACGHEHNYESQFPTLNLQPTQTDFINPRATTYVVDGAGGAPTLDLFGAPGPFTRKQDSSWGWSRVTVQNSTHLLWERVANDHCRDQCQQATCPDCGVVAGTVTDSWVLVQEAHGPWAR